MRLTSTLRNWMMAALAVALGAVALGIPTSAAEVDGLPGSQGTETSLPLTESAVTINGRGDFSDLEITVNQTRNLAEQAISITWKGGTRTTTAPGRFGAHFLQIFQCWGDDDGTTPDNPGPPPEQCVAGGYDAKYGGFASGIYPEQFALTRVISASGWSNYDESKSKGVPDPIGTSLWMPFRAVDGTVVGAHTNADYRPTLDAEFWLNPYFNQLTTNEIPGAFTFPDGTGAELFQVNTGVQSSGLGCGQRVEPVGPDFRIPKCWLVIVPRGDPQSENANTPFEGIASDVGVSTSPLAPNAWKNRIAVPLEFNPVDSPCRLGQDERRLSGNETAYAAVASWQPAICAGGALPPFNYVPVGDPAARRQLSNPAVGAPGMVVVSDALPPSDERQDKPVVYAPLTVSGLAIGVNIERKLGSDASQEARSRFNGTRVERLNLTPRLVAKLLTQSYGRAISVGSSTPPYDWPRSNPQSLLNDPDFIQFNPEFEILSVDSRNVASLTVPTGNSDAAAQLWAWILDDDEARAWLDGNADEWGMVVNPVYSTSPESNTNGFAFGSPTPVSFPKSDPYCFQPPPLGTQGVIAPPLCGTDWSPYASGFDQAAQIARRADDKAKVVLNQFALSSSFAWTAAGPQAIGERAIMAVVDTSSAQRYGLQIARLSVADDNGPDREFLAPTAASLTAAVSAMQPGDNQAVLDPKVPATAAGAYPLTMVTYAAIAPLALDTEARSDYAAFIEYAAGPGQTPGFEYGRLPVGYVPLPENLRGQALAAAESVRTLVEPTPEPPRTPPQIPSTPAVESSSPTTPASAPISGPTPATPSVDRSASSTQRSTASATAPSSETADDTTTTVTSEAPAPLEAPLEESPSESFPTTETPTVMTPSEPVTPIRLAVPVLGGVGLLSALAALEMTKRPRRLQPAAPITSKTGVSG